MTKVVAPRFDLDECANEQEKEFIDVLHSRAEVGGWCASSSRSDCDDRLIIYFDTDYMERHRGSRTLRIDFDGSVLTVGRDETGQLVTDLNTLWPEVIVMADQAPGMLANAAADWLELAMKRPVMRDEWNRTPFSRRKWI
jgi:hypothetical protein